MNSVKYAYAAYQRFLNRFPIASQAIQTGILMGTGDLISQTIVEKKGLHDINLMRLSTFTGLGTCIVGPAVSLWYGVLDKYLKGQTMKKVALDQLVFAPSFLVIMLTGIGLTRCLSFRDIQKEIAETYWDILITNYQVWPLIQTVNFAFVPLQYQVLLVQCVAIGWNTYISWKTHKSSDAD